MHVSYINPNKKTKKPPHVFSFFAMCSGDVTKLPLKVIGNIEEKLISNPENFMAGLEALQNIWLNKGDNPLIKPMVEGAMVDFAMAYPHKSQEFINRALEKLANEETGNTPSKKIKEILPSRFLTQTTKQLKVVDNEGSAGFKTIAMFPPPRHLKNLST